MSCPGRLSILVCLCLGAAAPWTAALAPPAGASEGGPSPSMPAKGASDLRLPPLASFAETVARPLFVRGRRPPDTPVPGAPAARGALLAPPPSAPRLSVAGIAMSGGKGTALVVVEGAAKPLSLVEGGEVAGWTVTAIAPDSIRLEKGAEAFEAALRGFKKGT